MSDENLSLIYTFSKKFSDPETNLSFDPKNQNISAVVKEGNVNISLLVKGQKEDLYINIARFFRKKTPESQIQEEVFKKYRIFDAIPDFARDSTLNIYLI